MKWHAFVVKQRGHDIGVAPVPSTAQESVAVDDAVTGQLGFGQEQGSAPTRPSAPRVGSPSARAIAP